MHRMLFVIISMVTTLVTCPRAHFPLMEPAMWHSAFWCPNDILICPVNFAVTLKWSYCTSWETDRALEICSRLPHHFFAWHFGIRVGEASCPGPKEVRVCITNPTAIYKKVSDLLKFGGQVILASETSATSAVQSVVRHEFSKANFSSFFSPPVGSKIETDDLRPSFRGAPIGTAIFSSLPTRVARVDIPVALRESCRFCCNITRISGVETFVACIYGFQRKIIDGKRVNDILLACVFRLVVDLGMPFIIGGDFNEPIAGLPIFDAFKEMGAVEAFHLFEAKFGCRLAPTCKGVTRNDSAILHPFIAQKVRNMIVSQEHQIDVHTPLFIDLDNDSPNPEFFNWKIPKSWAHLISSPSVLENPYQHSRLKYQDQWQCIQTAEEGHNALKLWSQAVETAVDKAVQYQHSHDPLRNPQKCLPSHFKGRCGANCFRLEQTKVSCRDDPTKAYNPPSEIFSIRNKQKIKRTRRIRSFLRAIKAASLRPDRAYEMQLQQEWNKIKIARGYGNRWDHWIISFELIPYVPVDIPDFALVELMCEITQFDCDYHCKNESAQRQQLFQHKIRIDHDHNFGKLTYKLMKAKQGSSLTEVPVQTESNGKLLRSQKGLIRIIIDPDLPLQPGSNISFGDTILKH